MVSALAQNSSHIESNAGPKTDYQKLFSVTFDFTLDLGFNILPEHLSFFVFLGLRLLAFK